MKFGVFTDLHYDAIPDADRRVDDLFSSIDDEMNVNIHGMEGLYQRVSPEDVGMDYIWNNVSIKPRTSSLYIPSLPI